MAAGMVTRVASAVNQADCAASESSKPVAMLSTPNAAACQYGTVGARRAQIAPPMAVVNVPSTKTTAKYSGWAGSAATSADVETLPGQRARTAKPETMSKASMLMSPTARARKLRRGNSIDSLLANRSARRGRLKPLFLDDSSGWPSRRDHLRGHAALRPPAPIPRGALENARPPGASSQRLPSPATSWPAGTFTNWCSAHSHPHCPT